MMTSDARLIVETFSNAWKEIEQIHLQGKICSERHFQAELFHILKSQSAFSNKFGLHVEPVIYTASIKVNEIGLSGVIPDLLISEDEKIAACVELKYNPMGYVSFEKDVKNLSKFYALKGSSDYFFLRTNPVTGNWDETKYFVSESVILIYAQIGNESSFSIEHYQEIWSTKYTGLTEQPKFLTLIGSLNNRDAPKFYQEGNTLPVSA
jgi:hypothetical protein